MSEPFSLQCPIPISASDRILLAHGEGARLTRRLIHDEILAALNNPHLSTLADGAVLPPITGRIVMSTDSFVVQPLFFPIHAGQGDIGLLAVHGTINDLAVMGAEPMYLTLGLIIEEGLPLEVLRRVLRSVAQASREAGVAVVTGDTKVVPRGAADGLFLHTTGIGRMRPGVELSAKDVQAGDRVLVSGNIGDHGFAILACREGLEFEGDLASDSAALHGLVAELLTVPGVRFLRDATRGGVAAVLHELADETGLGVRIEESRLPISAVVRGASELLGIHPVHVANEGKLIAVVSAENVDAALAKMRQHPLGRDATEIGEIVRGAEKTVQIRGLLGRVRVLDEPSGSPLPRIC